MAFEFDCPECEFTSSDNDMDPVVENGQQHIRDAHGNMPERDEVVPYVFGP